MIGRVVAPTKLGFLYPDHAAEDDLPWLVNALCPDRSVSAEVAHTTIGEDAHTVEALTDTGARWRLRDGASILRSRDADVAVWACTSGSFVFGLAGARRQADELAEDVGATASSTSLAFVAALAALDVREVAVAASYPEPLAGRFLEFLKEAGCTVVNAGSRGIFTAAQVGRLDADAVLALVRGADHRRAQAVLVPDTAMHTVRLLDHLEATVDKPVLTANQVSVWEALRLAGAVRSRAGLGTLFALSDTVPAN